MDTKSDIKSISLESNNPIKLIFKENKSIDIPYCLLKRFELITLIKSECKDESNGISIPNVDIVDFVTLLGILLNSAYKYPNNLVESLTDNQYNLYNYLLTDQGLHNIIRECKREFLDIVDFVFTKYIIEDLLLSRHTNTITVGEYMKYFNIPENKKYVSEYALIDIDCGKYSITIQMRCNLTFNIILESIVDKYNKKLEKCGYDFNDIVNNLFDIYIPNYKPFSSNVLLTVRILIDTASHTSISVIIINVYKVGYENPNKRNINDISSKKDIIYKTTERQRTTKALMDQIEAVLNGLL
jgi:hypothetical protein